MQALERRHDLLADTGGRSARGEPVQDRLDLVRRRMPSRAQAVGREAVAKIAKLRLRSRAGRRRLDDLRPELLAAEAGVFVGLRAPELMVDVERAYAVAEGPKCMPKAGRVRATRDEAEHVAAGRNEVVPADVLLDPRTENAGVHERIVGSG